MGSPSIDDAIDDAIDAPLRSRGPQRKGLYQFASCGCDPGESGRNRNMVGRAARKQAA